MKFDLSKVLEVSARPAGAIFIASALILFFPASLLPFDFVDFRANYGLWIFIVLVVSFAILVSYLMTWIGSSIKSKYDTYLVWKTYRQILSKLSNKEKSFLNGYYGANESAIYVDMLNPIHRRLLSINVISIPTGLNIGGPNNMPGFIQPWVITLLDKNPAYLDIMQEDDSL